MKWVLIVLNVVVGVLFAGMMFGPAFFAMRAIIATHGDCVGIIGSSDGPTSIYTASCFGPVGVPIAIIVFLLPFANAVMLYKLGKQKT